jgi:hypothetical protein
MLAILLRQASGLAHRPLSRSDDHGCVLNLPPGLVLEPHPVAGGRCVVCGSDVPAGEGIVARFRGRRVRLRCEGCLARFVADSDRYLGGHPTGCCDDEREASPASEWCV